MKNRHVIIVLKIVVPPSSVLPEVTGLAYAHDGLVLLTNDGIFAETLASAAATGSRNRGSP